MSLNIVILRLHRVFNPNKINKSLFMNNLRIQNICISNMTSVGGKKTVRLAQLENNL